MFTPANVGVVFPGAHTRGGVERVVLTVVEHYARSQPTSFVGEEFGGTQCGAVKFDPVRLRGGGASTRPLRFRKAAAANLALSRPETLISFGANCPPGDVYWVHSVHRAWVERGSPVTVRGVLVPAQMRRMLLRHQVLLHLERDYFTRHRPRAILCTSLQEVADLQEYYGVDPSILHAVPNGYDGERFNVAQGATWRALKRHEMGIREGEISLLFVVNELHRKGFGVLLEAVARADDDRLRIDVVGKAPIEPYAGRIRSLGLTGRVTWHGPTAQVEHSMAAGDVLVLPTQYEPFGLVVIEAMAMGLPVVTTALAGAAEAIEHGRSGLIQRDPNDAEELTALLARISDATARDELGTQGIIDVRPYEWGAVLERADRLIFPTSAGPG